MWRFEFKALLLVDRQNVLKFECIASHAGALIAKLFTITRKAGLRLPLHHL